MTTNGCLSVPNANVDVNVHVSMNGFSLVPNVNFSFPCRNWLPGKNDMFSVSRNVNFYFPCRNWFPRKNGMFSMPGGNSTWLRAVFFCESGEMLCVELHCSEVLPWNCFCWIFSGVRVRWSSIHISMDVWKCPTCSILSLLRNLALISSAGHVWYGFLSKTSFRSLGSKQILNFLLTV